MTDRTDATARWLTPEQVAELCEVSLATVYRRIEYGRLPAIKIGHKTIRVSPTALTEAIESGHLPRPRPT